MQVNGIQPYTVNNSSNTSFQARFKRKDIDLILDTAKQSDMPREVIPQIYTMLKFIDEEVPGKLARIDDIKKDVNIIFHYTRIFIDDNTEAIGKFVNSFKCSDRIINALENACIFNPKSKSGDYVRMPRIVFDREWWKNRKATERDISRLSYEHQFIKSV